MPLNNIFLYIGTHVYAHTHAVCSKPGCFTPVGGTWDFPDAASLVNLTGEISRDPSLLPLGTSALGAAAVIAPLRFEGRCWQRSCGSATREAEAPGDF